MDLVSHNPLVILSNDPGLADALHGLLPIGRDDVAVLPIADDVVGRCAMLRPPAVLIAAGEDAALTLLARLKADERTALIPAVLLLDRPMDNHAKALGHGAIACLHRPFSISELRARIRATLELGSNVAALKRSAMVDPLTGLWNRAHFIDRLEASIADAHRSGAPLSLALGDLDHFKQLNDSYGHVVGDAVLRAFADILVREIRRIDVACRYGGEEFAIILPRAGAPRAVQVCDRIRRAVARHRVPGVGERSITVSFGVTDAGLGDPSDPMAWIAAADDALYAAKDAGRDRVRRHEHPGPPGPVRLAS